MDGSERGGVNEKNLSLMSPAVIYIFLGDQYLPYPSKGLTSKTLERIHGNFSLVSTKQMSDFLSLTIED